MTICIAILFFCQLPYTGFNRHFLQWNSFHFLQISIVMVYFQLCSENYHWWWRSFFVSGGSAIYVFAYSVFYFYTKLDIDEFVPTLLYFSYTLMMVVTFWLLTGTIGFYAAFFFIRKIYAAVKIDWWNNIIIIITTTIIVCTF